ncbi:response regulator transcription factor [Nitrospirillum iridis]|uniref:response regulator transcription factor n=1 Tax=Nitrospirillum iridis TaxID=765888 RepID=UPI0016130EC2|nr:response regulator transcription factor [Nitrospirillum iridis]
MRLLIADDHGLVRDALSSHIERQAPGAVVAGVASVDEAVVALRQDKAIDLLILDLRMPGMNGLDGLQRVRTEFPALKVALMSGLARPDEIRGAFTRGAVGFLPKTLSATELLSAIQTMLQGERFIPTDLNTADTADGASFTRREREVLDYLLQGRSNKEIARSLELEEVTVKLHVRGICRKLGAKNRTQAVMRAVEMGIAS